MKAQRFTLHANDHGRAFVLSNAQAFLARLPESKSWRIEVSQVRKTRTSKQRAALFGVAYGSIMEFMGLRGGREQEELHHFFCGEYFGWKTDAIGRRVPKRTTTTNEQGEHEEIDTHTSNDFYSFIQQKAAENGIDVPDPDPLYNDGR